MAEREPYDRQKDWEGGDYWNPKSSGGLPRETTRKEYLLIASVLYQVTAVLRDKVLPHFPANGALPDKDLVLTAVHEWGAQFNLDHRWVLEQVEITLNVWRLTPELCKLNTANPLWHPVFEHIVRRPRPEGARPFFFSFQQLYFKIEKGQPSDYQAPGGWYPELHRREVFISEARKQFDISLKNYCDEEERAATDRGLIRVKRRRKREVPHLSKVEWAVHRYCGKLSIDSIAEKHRKATSQIVDESTIIKAVKEIADLIGLSE